MEIYIKISQSRNRDYCEKEDLGRCEFKNRQKKKKKASSRGDEEKRIIIIIKKRKIKKKQSTKRKDKEFLFHNYSAPFFLFFFFFLNKTDLVACIINLYRVFNIYFCFELIPFSVFSTSHCYCRAEAQV